MWNQFAPVGVATNGGFCGEQTVVEQVSAPKEIAGKGPGGRVLEEIKIPTWSRKVESDLAPKNCPSPRAREAFLSFPPHPSRGAHPLHRTTR
jgi:hypothetical protein